MSQEEISLFKELPDSTPRLTRSARHHRSGHLGEHRRGLLELIGGETAVFQREQPDIPGRGLQHRPASGRDRDHRGSSRLRANFDQLGTHQIGDDRSRVLTRRQPSERKLDDRPRTPLGEISEDAPLIGRLAAQAIGVPLRGRETRDKHARGNEQSTKGDWPPRSRP